MGKNKENLLPKVNYISSENLIKTGIQIAPAQFVVERSSYLRKQNIKQQSYVLGTSVLSSGKRRSVTTFDTFQYFVAEPQPTIQSQATTTTDMCSIYMEESAIADCDSATKETSVPFYQYGFFHRFHKYLTFIVMLMSLLTGASVMTSCHKEPYDVVIDWDWDNNYGLGLAPSKEIIQNELNKKNVNTVFINFNEMNKTNWNPASFHRARDTLQTRLDMAPGRVRGMGTIYVASDNGAHMPDVTEMITSGMALEDSIWYTANGWKVQRLHPLNSK